MKRLTVSLQTIADQRDALDRLEGYPKPPAFVGGALEELIPDEWYPGAPGWTEHLCDVQISEDGKSAWIDVPDAIVAQHDGASVDLDGRTVIVDFSAAIDLPE